MNKSRYFFEPDLWSGDQGLTGRKLPAGPNSTPRFLAAQRSAVSSRREEIAFVALAAQHNKRVCGPLCDPMGSSSSSAYPSQSISYGFLLALSFWIAIATRFVATYNDQTAEQQIWQSSPPQGIFALQKSLRGNCGGDGVPAAVGSGSRPRKEISRGNLLCAESGLPDLSYPRLADHSKVRNNARQENTQYRAAPGCQRDRGPSVSGRVQRNPFQGVPLGNFFLTVDAVLLCAAKKNGVETYQAGRALPVNPWSSDHGSSQKAPRCRARQ